MVAQQLGNAPAGVRGRALADERRGLGDAAAQPEGDDCEACADDEGHAPAPGVELRLVEDHELEQEQEEQREQLAHYQRDILEARPEAAVRGRRHLGEVGRRRAIFAADAEALDHPRDD